jgi:hypothetical protein
VGGAENGWVDAKMGGWMRKRPGGAENEWVELKRVGGGENGWVDAKTGVGGCKRVGGLMWQPKELWVGGRQSESLWGGGGLPIQV